MRIGWKTWTDRLSLLVLLVIPTLWALQGRGILNMQGEIIGATIMGWTLVLQFYFRRREPEPNSGGSTPGG